MVVSESFIWQALRLDLVNNEDSPPSQEPVDREFVAALIENAETRLETFLGHPLSDFDGGIPSDLALAVSIDVSQSYFNRMAPDLPDAYWQLLKPYRAWGFGRAVEDA